MVFDLVFLAFGTPYRSGKLGRSSILGAPWEVYAIERTAPMRYSHLLLEPDRVTLETVNPGTVDYGRLKKWIEKRNILSDHQARCHVTEDEAIDILVRNLRDAPQA